MTAGPALIVAAAAAPLTVFAWVKYRLRSVGDDPTFGAAPGFVAALAGGAVIGPIVAIASYGIAALVAGFLVQGLVEPGRALLRQLGADPSLTGVMRSTWVLVLLIELVVIAPLTEEAGKALGGRLGKPMDRRAAFLCGVAAGTGFAIVENMVYGWGAVSFGAAWEPVIATRVFCAAMHPLATGLVMLGWWDWRENRDPAALARGYLAGVGVHALWNGAQVAMIVVVASSSASRGVITFAALAFTGALGVVMMGALWRLTDVVAAGGEVRAGALSEPKAMAGWILLSSTMLVPVAFVAFLFPEFLGS